MKNYDHPTQVHFFHPESADEGAESWIYGIAYNDTIICACCGAVIPLYEAENITELSWVSFVNEIRDEKLDEKPKKRRNKK